MSVKDDLAGVLADSLNKKFKDYKVAYFLDGTDNTPINYHQKRHISVKKHSHNIPTASNLIIPIYYFQIIELSNKTH